MLNPRNIKFEFLFFLVRVSHDRPAAGHLRLRLDDHDHGHRIGSPEIDRRQRAGLHFTHLFFVRSSKKLDRLMIEYIFVEEVHFSGKKKYQTLFLYFLSVLS